MKIHIKAAAIFASCFVAGCANLDLHPLSEGATETFYSNQEELELAVNELYKIEFWGNDNPEYGDSYWSRGALGNPVTFGTLNSDAGFVLEYWENAYKQISKANSYLANMHRARENTLPFIFSRLEAEVRFVRAYSYANLITHFGDVPFMTEPISLEESYQLTRTDKETILQFIMEELDQAAEALPVSYGAGEFQRFTKGAALAIKARIALYTGKWREAATAAKAVMELGVYSLYPDYRELFLSPGKTSDEIIISFPRSESQGIFISGFPIQQHLPRIRGGTAALIPTWEIVDSYECVDGLPIDESPLYNPRDPFANRDPRMTMSIVEFGTEWLGCSYQPHPDSLEVMDYTTGQMVNNLDSRGVQTYASWTGFLWKKEVDQSWVDKKISDRDLILLRYAEVLLTYAESKIELGEIDQSVLDAINLVRARAYGVDKAQTSEYPAVVSTDADKLRTVIKRERRVEFTKEGLRYMDLIRWRIAEKGLARPVLGFADPENQDRSQWPFAAPPVIDEDGIPDYTALLSRVKILATRDFDKTKQYLWPIPSAEIILNQNLVQNPGY